MALGATQQSPGADRHLMAQAELESRLRVLMGGYAAERLVLGEHLDGRRERPQGGDAAGSRMVAHYGMSERLGPVYYDHDAEHPFLGKRVATEGGTSPATTTRSRRRRGGSWAARWTRPPRCSSGSGGAGSAVAALIERESLERDELVAILGRARRRR